MHYRKKLYRYAQESGAERRPVGDIGWILECSNLMNPTLRYVFDVDRKFSSVVVANPDIVVLFFENRIVGYAREGNLYLFLHESDIILDYCLYCYRVVTVNHLYTI